MPTTRSKRPAPTPPSSTRHTRPRTTVPTLTSLPYHILRQIFLHTVPSPPSPPTSPHALLKLAQSHPNLTAPCLNVLYHTPLLEPPSRAFDLLALLRTRPDVAHLIRVLVIPVYPLLERKIPHLGFFPFTEFLKLCTGLKEVWITQAADWPPYRTPTYAVTTRWSFTEELLEAVSPRRLVAWNWDQTFLDILDFDGLEKAHRLPCFQSLARLRFSRFRAAIAGKARPPKNTCHDFALNAARIIGLLPHLTSLELSHSLAINDTFLRALSETHLRLRSLTLMNLNDSTLLGDGIIAEILTTPLCHQLEELEILHCRATNLAFLQCLPKGLTRLRYDGLYFSTSSITTVATVPLYDELFPFFVGPGISIPDTEEEDQNDNDNDDDANDTHTPSLLWPPKLHNLTLLNLRKWSTHSAGSLLRSLTSRANSDLSLDRLELHVILDGSSWRERAAFRDRWEERLVKRFAETGKVLVRVDAQRPGEVQFDEGSFMKGGSVLGKAVDDYEEEEDEDYEE
ncbi:hypothetical protein EX30DRAFT_78222 [Ascodesmis nigricans]|uniref:Uncharacterized protein n=1 Tax=Ascodesmis nigricans TaxID=341454 RepID=A0A4S2MSE4_9PEZI|nr:hypothetical protein EX30DRAFT_78222 [Ascodesmis nigricans]